MTRLLMFLSFFPASYVVIVTASEGTLGWYIGGYVLGYVGGKGVDRWSARGGINSGVDTTEDERDNISPVVSKPTRKRR